MVVELVAVALPHRLSVWEGKRRLWPAAGSCGLALHGCALKWFSMRKRGLTTRESRVVFCNYTATNDSVPLAWLATSATKPSGVTATPEGLKKPRCLRTIVSVWVLMTVKEFPASVT